MATGISRQTMIVRMIAAAPLPCAYSIVSARLGAAVALVLPRPDGHRHGE